MKDRRIPDSAMTASSTHSNNGYLAHHGRLDNTGDPGGFWHPESNFEMTCMLLIVRFKLLTSCFGQIIIYSGQIFFPPAFKILIVQV